MPPPSPAPDLIALALPRRLAEAIAWVREHGGAIAASREAAQTDGGAGVIGGDELDEEESDQ